KSASDSPLFEWYCFNDDCSSFANIDGSSRPNQNMPFIHRFDHALYPDAPYYPYRAARGVWNCINKDFNLFETGFNNTGVYENKIKNDYNRISLRINDADDFKTIVVTKNPNMRLTLLEYTSDVVSIKPE
ncbi:hypothetical protein PENTCL1PPCAC_3869, partial [Pristionchus entomophagus]